jgi:uncharacterized membrane protein
MGKIMAKEKYLLIGIILLGLGLRLTNLNQSFWLDEASQAQMSSLSLSQIWSARQADFHPPLFYFLTHFWLQLGRSESWLRLLPVFFGVVSIAFIYMFNKKIGLTAALFLAINPYHIYYSQEFRSYSLLAMLGLLSVLLMQRKKYIWMAVVNALLLYTHYSSIFLIFTQFIINPISIFYFPLSLILYLPWIPQFFEQLQSGVDIDTFLPGWRNILSLTPVKAIPEILFKFMAGRINLFPRWLYAIYIIFVLSSLGLSVLVNQIQRRLLWLWLGLPILASLLVSLWLPQTQPFRLIFALPALILILAGATIRFPKLIITLVVYISIVGNILYFTRPRLQREQWRQAISYLSLQQEVIMVNYLGKLAPFIWYSPNLKVVDKIPIGVSSFYYLEYLTGLTDPEHQIQKELESKKWKVVETKNFEGVGLIYKYAKL